MKYNGYSGSNRQALAIEDAEIRILEISKNAVLHRYTQSRFVNEINAIISELISELESDSLKKRVAEPLRRYAVKTFERETRLFREKAFFYAAVTVAMHRKNNVPQAQRLMSTVIRNEYSPNLLRSEGFRKLVDDFRPRHEMYNAALPLDKYHKEYTETVATLTKELVLSDAKEDYSTNVNLRNIAEMTVRYEHQQEMVNDFRSKGTKLVYIVPHTGCSKRCEPWQVGGSAHPSGLYSLDGTSGTTPEGIPYIPLEKATNITVTTRSGKTYTNGCITGYNCRHQLKAYAPNTPVSPIPDEAIEQRRKIEEKQRAYEREIRYQKRLYVQARGNSPEVAREARARAVELNAEYRKYSADNNVAYFDERTKILEGEETFLLRKPDAERLGIT